MSTRWQLQLEALMAVAALAFCVGIATLGIIDASSSTVDLTRNLDTFIGDFVIGVAFLSVGMFLAIRKPGHLVGLALLTTAIGISTYAYFSAYAEFALAPDTNAPGFRVAATGASFTWPLILGGLFLLVLSFPGGSLPGDGWRRFNRLWIGAAILLMISYWVIPGMLEPPYEAVRGPLVVNGLEALEPVTYAFSAVLLLGTAAAGINLVMRFVRSRGIEREQFRWLAFSAAIAVLIFPFSNFSPVLEDLQGITFLLFPFSVGIAILRYRLYDIDRIINRTLVYGSLTAVLVAVYAGLVIGLQELLRPLSGGSDLAIVFTTLTVAAMFMPARRRLQTLVDRRFNRRSYDAARTVEAFSARLRENIDLDTLRYELLSVIDQTMAPTQTSLLLTRRNDLGTS